MTEWGHPGCLGRGSSGSLWFCRKVGLGAGKGRNGGPRHSRASQCRAHARSGGWETWDGWEKGSRGVLMSRNGGFRGVPVPGSQAPLAAPGAPSPSAGAIALLGADPSGAGWEMRQCPREGGGTGGSLPAVPREGSVNPSESQSPPVWLQTHPVYSQLPSACTLSFPVAPSSSQHVHRWLPAWA